ncbi:MAG TPA: competence protein CoiA family protein [Chondromyces sp.]|nr:competence protein CoiA family protein [Chondromyces sp.]
MLIANDQTGLPVNLTEQRTPKEMAELKRRGGYICPQCQTPVILKAGPIKIPHFAHQRLSSCESFSEPESSRHLKGKIDLFHWFTQFYQTELEAYLPEIRQRPDVFLPALRAAIEFQCSAISAEQFAKRSHSYLKNGYRPIWLFGGKEVKRKGSYYPLSPFLQLFFQFSPEFGLWFIRYCPDDESFTFYLQITPITPSLFHASTLKVPLKHASFPFLFQKPEAIHIPYTLHHWMKAKQRWLQQQMVFQTGRQHPFLQRVYAKGQNPFLLPTIVGLPVRLMAILKNHPIEWQFYLWEDIYSNGGVTSVNQGETILQRRIKENILKRRYWPLVSENLLRMMVSDYFKLLVMVGIMRETKREEYTLLVNPVLSATIYQQIKSEEEFCEIFGKQTIRRLIF